MHPTGFVDPKEPASLTKFLAPEKLRGVGGILFNSLGQRFVDELTTRDVVSHAIFQQPGQAAFLLLSEEAAAAYGAQAIAFYVAKGLMTKVADVAGAAGVLGGGVDAGRLDAELRAYNDGAASGSDAFGKSAFPGRVDLGAPLYIASVVPVVHYTMGGLEIDAEARVLRGGGGGPLPGLFAAGEVSGGVHGKNRLGGNSLLECAVYGRVAAQSAVQYLLALSRL